MENSKSKITDSNYFLGKVITVTVDRPLGSKHPKYDWKYELNYGFIKNTMSDDGEELDAYVVGVNEPLSSFDGRCIAIIHRTNDNDDKLVVAPLGVELTDDEIMSSTKFQEQFFKSEIIRLNKTI